MLHVTSLLLRSMAARPASAKLSFVHQQHGSICRATSALLQSRHGVTRMLANINLIDRAWRYFAVFPCPDHWRETLGDSDNQHRRPVACLHFKDQVIETFVGAVASMDGIRFGAVRVLLNASWHGAHMTHNLAIAPWHGELGRGYALVGGQHNLDAVRPGEKPNNGVWLASWLPHERKATGASEVVGEAQWLFNGSHPGCVERRWRAEGRYLYPGSENTSRACEFDGRLSLVFFRHEWLLFARANPMARGRRHVQVTRSPDAQHSWSPFRQVRFHGMHNTDHDVYFFLVQVNPALPATLIAVFPLFHRAGGEADGCTGISLSLDGVEWSTPTPLSLCSVDGVDLVDRRRGRVLCFPAGLAPSADANHLLLYVHESVPMEDKYPRGAPLPWGQHARQPAPRLVVHRIPNGLLRDWTRVAFASLSKGRARARARGTSLPDASRMQRAVGGLS